MRNTIHYSKISFLALSALLTVGCFFGGANDSSTGPTQEYPKSTDALVQAREIVPGVYSGDYSWIDSNKHGLESEFILDANGSYRLFWISDNDAVFDQQGYWAQRDSKFFFSGVQEGWVANGIFDLFTKAADDTNSLRDVTDSSFSRLEWTPLRQKPYWISYNKITPPQLTEGEYVLEKALGEKSSLVNFKFKISLSGDSFFFSAMHDTVESFQAEAKFYQIGSFLVTVQNRQRETDSAETFPEWNPISGSMLKRLMTVSDSAFSMWNPSTVFQSGSWDPYNQTKK